MGERDLIALRSKPEQASLALRLRSMSLTRRSLLTSAAALLMLSAVPATSAPVTAGAALAIEHEAAPVAEPARWRRHRRHHRRRRRRHRARRRHRRDRGEGWRRPTMNDGWY